MNASFKYILGGLITTVLLASCSPKVADATGGNNSSSMSNMSGNNNNNTGQQQNSNTKRLPYTNSAPVKMAR